jgi:hypothetical protein
VDILTNKFDLKISMLEGKASEKQLPTLTFFTQTIIQGEGFEFEMHVSISKVLLGLTLVAAATVRNLDAASSRRSERKGGGDRCPKGQQVRDKAW